jgi:hypothetical protein
MCQSEFAGCSNLQMKAPIKELNNAERQWKSSSNLGI